MRELLDLLSGNVTFPTLWVVAGALLLVAAGARSALPAIMAALLIFLYYILSIFTAV